MNGGDADNLEGDKSRLQRRKQTNCNKSCPIHLKIYVICMFYPVAENRCNIYVLYIIALI